MEGNVLKACPFCGGEAWFWTKESRFGYFAWVECETCGCRTKAVSTRIQADDDGFKDSTAAKVLGASWNRRKEEV